MYVGKKIAQFDLKETLIFLFVYSESKDDKNIAIRKVIILLISSPMYN